MRSATVHALVSDPLHLKFCLWDSPVMCLLCRFYCFHWWMTFCYVACTTWWAKPWPPRRVHLLTPRTCECARSREKWGLKLFQCYSDFFPFPDLIFLLWPEWIFPLAFIRHANFFMKYFISCFIWSSLNWLLKLGNKDGECTRVERPLQGPHRLVLRLERHCSSAASTGTSRVWGCLSFHSTELYEYKMPVLDHFWLQK